MKKTLLVGLAIGLVSVAATSVFAGPSKRMVIPAQGIQTLDPSANDGGAGIVGSSHDLSNVGHGLGAGVGGTTASGQAALYVGNMDRQSRICVYCHHPHNADSAGTGNNNGGVSGTKQGIGSYSPLWNRNLSTRAFAAYNNGAMMNESTSVTGSDKRHVLNAGSNVLSGVSLLCMSCHDGVVAMNAYSQTTGSSEGKGNLTGVTTGITSTAGFKSDMNNHHPMGFVYATVQAKDKEIAAPTTVMVPSDADISSADPNRILTGTTTIGDLLYGSPAGATFECVTCHDVHNTANATHAERFLWRSNNQSNFCLTCHLK